jgi:hypothetical protein
VAWLDGSSGDHVKTRDRSRENRMLHREVNEDGPHRQSEGSTELPLQMFEKISGWKGDRGRCRDCSVIVRRGHEGFQEDDSGLSEVGQGLEEERKRNRMIGIPSTAAVVWLLTFEEVSVESTRQSCCVGWVQVLRLTAAHRTLLLRPQLTWGEGRVGLLHLRWWVWWWVWERGREGRRDEQTKSHRSQSERDRNLQSVHSLRVVSQEWKRNLIPPREQEETIALQRLVDISWQNISPRDGLTGHILLWHSLPMVHSTIESYAEEWNQIVEWVRSEWKQLEGKGRTLRLSNHQKGNHVVNLSFLFLVLTVVLIVVRQMVRWR